LIFISSAFQVFNYDLIIHLIFPVAELEARLLITSQSRSRIQIFNTNLVLVLHSNLILKASHIDGFSIQDDNSEVAYFLLDHPVYRLTASVSCVCFQQFGIGYSFIWCSWRLLVSQLGCGLSGQVDQRMFHDIVAQDVDQRTDEAITVRHQNHHVADVDAKHRHIDMSIRRDVP